MRSRVSSAKGQSMIEFAMILPLVVVTVLGIIEVGYALLDQHVVTKLTREGSNLISRDVTLQDAAAAMQNMATRPVNFGASSRLIFSVIRKIPTVSAANYNQIVLYQRYEFGSLAATSQLTTAGTGSFGGPPDYQATNADSDTRLQITNLPGTMLSLGGMLYITEIYSRHTLITPFDQFGITIPNTLYSIAYF